MFATAYLVVDRSGAGRGKGWLQGLISSCEAISSSYPVDMCVTAVSPCITSPYTWPVLLWAVTTMILLLYFFPSLHIDTPYATHSVPVMIKPGKDQRR